MSPLDRINQLTDENALLRTQLRDAQEQAKRDTETIARLSSHEALLRADLERLTAEWNKHKAHKCTP